MWIYLSHGTRWPLSLPGRSAAWHKEAYTCLASSPCVSIRHSQMRQPHVTACQSPSTHPTKHVGEKLWVRTHCVGGQKERPPWGEASHSWKSWNYSVSEEPGEVTASQPRTHHICSLAPREYSCLLEQFPLQIMFRQLYKPLFSSIKWT